MLSQDAESNPRRLALVAAALVGYAVVALALIAVGLLYAWVFSSFSTTHGEAVVFGLSMMASAVVPCWFGLGLIARKRSMRSAVMVVHTLGVLVALLGLLLVTMFHIQKGFVFHPMVLLICIGFAGINLLGMQAWSKVQ